MTALGATLADARARAYEAAGADLLAGHAVPPGHRRRGRPGQKGQRLVIPRYSLPEMASLWSDEARFSTMLEIEILAVEAWSLLGTVPAEDVATIRERTAGMVTAADVAAIEERERITNHDVAAFVDVVADRVGQPAGAWVHYGLTSSDVTDTALSPHPHPGRRPPRRRRHRRSRRPSPTGPASCATSPWSAAPTASTPSRPRWGRSWPCGRCRSGATVTGSSGPATP